MSADSTRAQFEEDVRRFGVSDAIREAKRCLNCGKPACKNGCPVGNDIPEFVQAVAHGNIGEAKEIIARKSNLPAVCGRVCAHEIQCEGNCVLGKAGKHIQIGLLEAFVADFAFTMRLTRPRIAAQDRGKVAVIGSGPAGLTVAGDLSKMGFHVTVYESQPEPGGVLLYGIPAFRLPKEVVRREIREMEAGGIAFITNATAGKDFTVDQLLENEFDAAFIGSGTALPRELDAPGNDLAGVIQSSYFLRMVSLFKSGQIERKEVPLEKHDIVRIVGCGNTAIDAARTALRLGVKAVSILDRGTRETMSALPAEYEEALSEGVEFFWERTPAEFLGRDGMLEGMRVTTPDGDQTFTATKVFLAIGSRPANRIVSTTSGIDVDAGGYIITKDRPYGMTTRQGVFAGGDVVHRPATVALAMKEAKRVAEGIAAYVDAVKLLSC